MNNQANFTGGSVLNLGKMCTLPDLRLGLEQTAIWQGMGVPVQEKPLLKDIDRVNKYNMLKGTAYFMSKQDRLNRGANKGRIYTMEDLLSDLGPQVKYYKEFNMKSAALEYFEQRIAQEPFGEEDRKQLLQAASKCKSLRAEFADEYGQTMLFREDFYPVS